jgi:hypothetical protein
MSEKRQIKFKATCQQMKPADEQKLLSLLDSLVAALMDNELERAKDEQHSKESEIDSDSPPEH